MKRTIFLIYVRPPGSHTWTQHMKNKVPWRSENADEANREAVKVVHSTRYCARVVFIKVPKEPDSEDHPQYAVLAN